MLFIVGIDCVGRVLQHLQVKVQDGKVVVRLQGCLVRAVIDKQRICRIWPEHGIGVVEAWVGSDSCVATLEMPIQFIEIL